MWSITLNARDVMNGSVHPNRNGTMIRCPEEEIGRNSVSPCTIPMTRAWANVSICVVPHPPKRGDGDALADEERGEDQGDARQQLHEDVERRAGRVLERVTDRVADDCRGVGLRALAED